MTAKGLFMLKHKRKCHQWNSKAAIVLSFLAIFVYISFFHQNIRSQTISHNTDYSALMLSGPPKCSNIPALLNIAQFYEYLDEENKSCQSMITVGGHPKRGKDEFIDGGKQVCTDPPYKLNAGNCTVLSFGIGTDFSFDDGMARLGCKVFCFDPLNGLKDHIRSPRIQFFRLGIGGPNDYGPLPRADRYDNIIHSLDLQNTDIDYLKMDVEGSEIGFFEEVFESSFYLLKKVKQIGIEIHSGHYLGKGKEDDRLPKLWDFFHKLECSGFRKVFVEANRYEGNQYIVDGKNRSECYEMLWAQQQPEPNNSKGS